MLQSVICIFTLLYITGIVQCYDHEFVLVSLIVCSYFVTTIIHETNERKHVYWLGSVL